MTSETGRTGLLVVVCGLPGVGKTAVARGVADRLGATFLRIDSIESAIASTLHPYEDSPVGYEVAGRVSADQLRSGRPVVVDAVNAVEAARAGWREVARGTGATLRWVEVVCSDQGEHRRRVESRGSEMPGHVVPTWDEVTARTWEPFTEDRYVVDNLGDLAVHVDEVVAWVR